MFNAATYSIYMFASLWSVVGSYWAKSGFALWVMLEVSSYSVLNIAKSGENKNFTNSAAIYFNVQAVGSFMAAVGLIYPHLVGLFWTTDVPGGPIFLFYIGWAIKMGIGPFIWGPTVAGSWDWPGIFFLLGVNKLVGSVVLAKVGAAGWICNAILLFCVFSSINAVWGTFLTTSLSGLLTYSSIHTISWSTFLALYWGVKVVSIFMCIYILSLMTLIIQLWYLGYDFLWSPLSFKPESGGAVKRYYALVGNMLSSAGFPLIAGFVPKAYGYIMMLSSGQLAFTGLFSLLSAVLIYWYLKFFFVLTLALMKPNVGIPQVNKSRLVSWTFFWLVPHVGICIGGLNTFFLFVFGV